MGRIQFSKEVFRKLSGSPSLDGDSRMLLSKFDPDRPIKAGSRKPKVKPVKNNSKAPSKVTSKVAPKSTPKSRSIKKQEKRRLRALKQEKEKARRQSIYKRKIELAKKMSVRNPFVPLQTFEVKRPAQRSLAARPTQRSDAKPLYDSKGHDNYDLAGEYSARNVEFGHGRRKSEEWNSTMAEKMRSELEELRRMRRDDPNMFDRQAMK